MRRLSKALIEQEQSETSVAICRAMALHDQCRVDMLQYHFVRLEHILAYINEKAGSIPPISDEYIYFG